MRENIVFGMSPFLFEPIGGGSGGRRGVTQSSPEVSERRRKWETSVRGNEAIPGMNDYKTWSSGFTEGDASTPGKRKTDTGSKPSGT